MAENSVEGIDNNVNCSEDLVDDSGVGSESHRSDTPQLLDEEIPQCDMFACQQNEDSNESETVTKHDTGISLNPDISSLQINNAIPRRSFDLKSHNSQKTNRLFSIFKRYFSLSLSFINYNTNYRKSLPNTSTNPEAMVAANSTTGLILESRPKY